MFNSTMAAMLDDSASRVSCFCDVLIYESRTGGAVEFCGVTPEGQLFVRTIAVSMGYDCVDGQSVAMDGLDAETAFEALDAQGLSTSTH